MQKTILLILGLTLMLLSANVFAQSNYVPLNYPDLENAFKVPAWRSWISPSGNNDPDSLKVPTHWQSPTTTNYTEFLNIPEWKTWNSPSTINYSASIRVPAWKSWKPLSYSSWDVVFKIPWR